MRVLVTGADGLLGSHLVRKLIERGDQVAALVQKGTEAPTIEGLPLERFQGDLLEKESGLKQAVSGCQAVIHCAAIANMWADRDLTWAVNLEGTRKVLEACIDEGAGRLVHIGTASSFAFGPLEDPGDETKPFSPVYRGMAYMESKHRAMELVQEYVNERGLDAVVVAPTFLLGAYDYRPSGGELVKQFIKRGMKYVSPGGRNFAYAGDVAGAAAAALEKGEAGEAYIAGGENLTYFDFFTRVARAYGIDPPRRVIPKPVVIAAGATGSLYNKVSGKRTPIDLRMAKVSCYDTYYSSDKAKRELGMTETPIEAAIEESIDSLKEYGHIK